MSLEIESADDSSLESLFTEYSEHLLKHLVHEERIMMPLVMKNAGKTSYDRSKFFAENVLSARDESTWKVHVAWTLQVRNARTSASYSNLVQILSAHGSTTQSASVATRVWVWGLQHALPSDAWRSILPTIEENVSEEIWTELVTKWRIESTDECLDKGPHKCLAAPCIASGLKVAS